LALKGVDDSILIQVIILVIAWGKVGAHLGIVVVNSFLQGECPDTLVIHIVAFSVVFLLPLFEPNDLAFLVLVVLVVFVAVLFLWVFVVYCQLFLFLFNQVNVLQLIFIVTSDIIAEDIILLMITSFLTVLSSFRLTFFVNLNILL
jgi:hypothetical protein